MKLKKKTNPDGWIVYSVESGGIRVSREYATEPDDTVVLEQFKELIKELKQKQKEKWKEMSQQDGEKLSEIASPMIEGLPDLIGSSD